MLQLDGTDLLMMTRFSFCANFDKTTFLQVIQMLGQTYTYVSLSCLLIERLHRLFPKFFSKCRECTSCENSVKFMQFCFQLEFANLTRILQDLLSDNASSYKTLQKFLYRYCRFFFNESILLYIIVTYKIS